MHSYDIGLQNIVIRDCDKVAAADCPVFTIKLLKTATDNIRIRIQSYFMLQISESSSDLRHYYAQKRTTTLRNTMVG